MKHLIAFGDANVDLITEIPCNRTIANSRQQTEAQLFSGGTIANTAIGVAKLGVETIVAGKIGKDNFGDFLKKELRKNNVCTKYLIEDKNVFTTMVLAFIDAEGEKHNVTFPKKGGAYFNIEYPEINTSIWNNAAWLHCSGICLGEEPSRTTCLKFMQEAKKRNITTSFDLNLRLEYFGWRDGVYKATLKAMSLSNIVFASVYDELLPLTQTNTAYEAFTELEKLNKPAYNQTLICRDGGNPVIVKNNKKIISSPCFKVSIVDSLGAGDAFNAGFIAASMNGKNLEESLLQAQAVAGYNLTQKGAGTMPTKNQLAKFIKTHKRTNSM